MNPVCNNSEKICKEKTIHTNKRLPNKSHQIIIHLADEWISKSAHNEALYWITNLE